MSTKVRALDAAERSKLGELLARIHEHMDGCSTCVLSPDPPDGMCSAGAELYAVWEAFLDASEMSKELDRMLGGGTCVKCGKPGDPVCFNCFLGRPFERLVICNVCGEEKPIVRLYLSGPACDDCAPAKRLVPAAR